MSAGAQEALLAAPKKRESLGPVPFSCVPLFYQRCLQLHVPPDRPTEPPDQQLRNPELFAPSFFLVLIYTVVAMTGSATNFFGVDIKCSTTPYLPIQLYNGSTLPSLISCYKQPPFCLTRGQPGCWQVSTPTFTASTCMQTYVWRTNGLYLAWGASALGLLLLAAFVWYVSAFPFHEPAESCIAQCSSECSKKSSLAVAQWCSGCTQRTLLRCCGTTDIAIRGALLVAAILVGVYVFCLLVAQSFTNENIVATIANDCPQLATIVVKNIGTPVYVIGAVSGLVTGLIINRLSLAFHALGGVAKLQEVACRRRSGAPPPPAVASEQAAPPLPTAPAGSDKEGAVLCGNPLQQQALGATQGPPVAHPSLPGTPLAPQLNAPPFQYAVPAYSSGNINNGHPGPAMYGRGVATWGERRS